MEYITEKKKTPTIMIASLLVGILLVVMASAALVSYLSNSVTTNVAVTSPIEVRQFDGSSYTLDSQSFSAYGGDTLLIDTRVHNEGNNDITANLSVKVNNSGGNVGCSDFNQMQIEVPKDSGAWYSLSCTDSGGVAYFTKPLSFISESSTEYNLKLVFAVNVQPDTYTFNTKVLV